MNINEIIQFLYWPSLLIILFGIAGNVFIFIIYSRLKRVSSALYFRIASLVDLFITLNWLKVFLREKYNINPVNISSFACKSLQFSIYSSGPISDWLQGAISLDRMLNIVYSTRKCSSILSSLKFQYSPFSPPTLPISS